jgi:hypothetical protein
MPRRVEIFDAVTEAWLGLLFDFSDDIIASKRAANRPKDRESLPRLEAFRDYLRSRNLTALPANPS